ncbi:FAD-binding domain-containing protein, partial [Cryphonectria parasitica EP155]
LLGADKVALPGSSAYNATLSSYFSLQAAAVHPLCFVTPQTTADVSALIGSLTSTNSNASCQFAIRSGGHMWFPGASNEPGGITVDLSSLDSIEVNAAAENSTVSVGVGATWDAVYAKLDPLGLSVAGGRVSGVGVGGLTLGGGLSYFGPRYGWTCTTASSFELVLANGSIVEANEESNTDLFYGLRGGSNNFGVVTRIVLKAFEQDQGLVWAGTVYSPLSTIDAQIETYVNLSAAETYDENASFITGLGYSQSSNLTVVTNDLVYTKPSGDGAPSLYQGFLDQPSLVSTTAIVNMSTLSQQQAAYLPPGVAQRLFATTTFRPTTEMLRAAFDAFNSSLAEVKGINGMTWTLSFEPLPPAIYQRDATKNALGLADRTGTFVVCLLSHGWTDEADNERVYAASASLLNTLEDAARTLGVYDAFIYLNYAAPWQNPIASYGNTSVQQLQELRARVDPKEVFTHLVPGGFKIPS